MSLNEVRGAQTCKGFEGYAPHLVRKEKQAGEVWPDALTCEEPEREMEWLEGFGALDELQ